MTIKPMLVDLNGGIARVDHQRGKTGHIRLMVCTEQDRDDAGNLVARGCVSEFWITADQADELADALKSGRAA